MRWLLEGGRVLDPASAIDEVADILIDNGQIAAVRPGLEVSDIPRVDARGRVVCPGFVDMHVHLREPGRSDKETVDTGVRAAVRGGFVAVGAMPNTQPPMDTPEMVESLARRGRSLGLAHVLPIPCITRGMRGERLAELGLLAAAGAVGFSDDGRCVMNAQVMRRALEYARMLDRPVIGHEEDEHLSNGGAVHEGAHSARLGLPAMAAAAEEVIVARDVILAEATGGWLHVAHVSTARSVAIIRDAKARGVRVTAEVTPHHLLLDDGELGAYDASMKMNPPLREARDRAALVEALADGTIDCIATDHAPHTTAEKDVEMGCAAFGVIGLETAVPVLLDRLVRTGHISLTRFVDACSTRPAEILRYEGGRIAPGRPASLTVLDLEKVERIAAEAFESKARNCPFVGWTVQGLPMMTIVDGRIVMRDRTVIDATESHRQQSP